MLNLASKESPKSKFAEILKASLLGLQELLLPTPTSATVTCATNSSSLKAIYNLKGSMKALFLSHLREGFIFIAKSEESARKAYQDILFYKKLLSSILPSSQNEILLIPSDDDPVSEGMRCRLINDFLKEPSSFDTRGLISDLGIFERRFWKPEVLNKKALLLKKGMEIERIALVDRLVNLGYRKAAVLTSPGEFCLRSFIIEVFPTNNEAPLRIEFFGDQIEQIRLFDMETQRTLPHSEINEIILLPARPPEPEEAITFQELLLSPPKPMSSLLRKKVFFEPATVTFALSLPKGIILSDLPFITEPLPAGEVTGQVVDAQALSLSGLRILYNERKGIEELSSALKNLSRENNILLCLRTSAQAKRLKDILFDHGLIAPIIPIEEAMDYEGPLAIIPESPSSGFYIKGFLLLTDYELFGPGPTTRPAPHYRLSRIFKEIEDLEEGDYVVHKVHGIGIYKGLQRLKIEDIEEDVLVIEYRDGARLYLPLRNISLIHKFRAQEGIVPQIDSLGGKTWKKTKEKVRAKIKEMAQKLLRLYAEREVSGGYAFSPDTELHREFASFFEYDETPDQLRAIEETIADMESPRPMERLIVGDVGYGKTEVAMRAAFKAVFDGKQVAVLVPTTLLAEQHLRVFRQRFSAFPVKIDYLSRLKNKKERQLTIEALQKGEIDIIIGTQALLSEKVRFFDLGLLIIDEEHRFGVRHKEKLKELKKGVDVLMLSATPIPRTLQMALSGLRNMSIIETPPQERQAIKTVIAPFDRETIKKAIELELERNGQVYFVHNRIKDIEDIKGFIERLVPQARVAVAHGQMNETLTEDIMLRFLNQEIDILVCTNIIGSGIDIPSVNTIIINRAHEMGLADLYQLRGRVGRSNIKAYCYLLAPPDEVISENAKKRLSAIADLSYLGAGIRLAMTDLEIRGAGNLLGPEQSGHINAVGFELYMELLEKAIRELRGEKIEEEIEPVIDIPLPALIPEEYVDEIHIRLNLYRRLSMIGSDEELLEFSKEVEERFGSLPEEVENLLKIVRLKNLCKNTGIKRLVLRNGRLELYSQKEFPKGLVENLLNCYLRHQSVLQDIKGNLSIAGSTRIIISLSGGDTIKQVSSTIELLKRLNSYFLHHGG